MADSYHFFMAMEKPPTATKQERKVRIVRDRDTGDERPAFYPSREWSAAEDTLRAHLEPHRPSERMTGPVMLSVVWCFPANGCADGAPWLDKPDTDNLEKGLKDIMTDLGWWEDDAQVFDSHTTKIHSRVTGIRIDIEEVGE